METFYWKTDEPLATNMDTMTDYIENCMPDDWVLLMQDGTYAEVEIPNGERFEMHASGDGDFCSHKIDFVPITSDN